MTKAESSSTSFPLGQSEGWNAAHANHVIRSGFVIGKKIDPQLEWVLMRDEDGDTPLHISVAKGDEVTSQTVVNILKGHHVTLDIKNELLQTPLHIAVITDNQPLVALFISNNPSSLAVCDRHGNNAAHLAVKYCTNSATLKTIFDACSMTALEAKNIYGLAPMHLAAIENKKDSILLLKRAGADVNILDNKSGASAIILAARTSQKEAAQALLELGANPNIRTTFGESASQVASSNGDRSMSELLSMYDNPYDGSRSGQRYALDRIRSNENGQHFQETSKHHIKPFVATTRQPLTLSSNPLRHQHMTSSQKARISPIYPTVKREPQTSPPKKNPFPKQDPHIRAINPYLPSSISQYARISRTQRAVYPQRYSETFIPPPPHNFHYSGGPIHPVYLPTLYKAPGTGITTSATSVPQQQRPKRKLPETQNEPLDLSSTALPKRSRSNSKIGIETTNDFEVRGVQKKETRTDLPSIWLPSLPINHIGPSSSAPKKLPDMASSLVTSPPHACPVKKSRAEMVYRQPSAPERIIHSDDQSKIAMRLNEKRPQVVRRNSAPVDNLKVHDKRRLDLHSYRGCLPPHLLDILESSGNLPTQSSNVLKKVSAVFPQQKEKTYRNVNEVPSTGCEQQSSVIIPTHGSPDKPNGKPTLCSPDMSRDKKSSPKVDAGIKASTKHVQQSLLHFSVGDKTPLMTSQKKSLTSQTLDETNSWKCFDSGNFPAFGQCFSVTGKLPNNGRESSHVMVNRHQVGFNIFRSNSKNVVSYETKKLLENASEKGSSTKPTVSNLALPTVLCACANVKHTCVGCSRVRHNVTLGNMVLEDIWKGKSERRYVTSSSAFKPTLVSSSQLPVNFPCELTAGKSNDVTKKPSSSNFDADIIAANMTSSVNVGFVHNATGRYNKESLSTTSEPDCVSEDSGTDTIEEIGEIGLKQRSEPQQKQPEQHQEIVRKQINLEIDLQQQKQQKIDLENNIKMMQHQKLAEEKRQKLLQSNYLNQLQKTAELDYRSQLFLEAAQRKHLHHQFEAEQRQKFEENLLRHQQRRIQQERFENMQKLAQLQQNKHLEIQINKFALLQHEQNQRKKRKIVAYPGISTPPVRTRKNSLDAKLDQRKHKALNEHQMRYEQTRNYEFIARGKIPTSLNVMNGLSSQIDGDILANEIQDSDDEIEDKIAHSSAQLAAKMNRNNAKSSLMKIAGLSSSSSFNNRPTVLKSLSLSKFPENKIINGIREDREINSVSMGTHVVNFSKNNLPRKPSSSLRLGSKNYASSNTRTDDINLCDLEISEDES